MNSSATVSRAPLTSANRCIEHPCLIRKSSLTALKQLFTALLFVCSLLLAHSSHAQVPAWQWAVQSNGSGHAEVINIAVDANGNSYAVGFFTETAQFGATTLVSHGRSDLFVAKLSPTGQWDWAVGAGSLESDRASGVAVDATGQVFITGFFNGQLSLGQTALTSRGDMDVFVAKLSPEGKWQWATAGGGTSIDRAYALTVSKTGEVLVAGQFAETATFGTSTLTSRGSTDVFVASLTRAGVWQWATSAGGSSNDAARALATTAAGEIYVTGYFSETGAFGSSTLTGRGMDDAFVGKLTSGGQWLWATAATGTNTAYGKGLVADPAGGVFVTGSYSGNAVFGATQLSSGGSDDGFVARLTDSGQWQWVSVLASDYLDNIAGIALDKMGKLYVAGTFSSTIRGAGFQLISRGHQDIFVGYLTPTGTWLGLVAAGGTAVDEVQALALAPSGEVCIGGAFSAAATFGSISLQSATADSQACVGRATVPQP
jgi:hypothetical protein